jgi:hypothetical protein
MYYQILETKKVFVLGGYMKFLQVGPAYLRVAFFLLLGGVVSVEVPVCDLGGSGRLLWGMEKRQVCERLWYNIISTLGQHFCGTLGGMWKNGTYMYLGFLRVHSFSAVHLFRWRVSCRCHIVCFTQFVYSSFYVLVTGWWCSRSLYLVTCWHCIC